MVERRMADRGVGWQWTTAWALVGAAWVLGVLSLLTIGVFVLAVALAGTALLAGSPRGRRAWDGLALGTGLPFLYVAALTIGGPASCGAASGSGTADGSAVDSCIETVSPWPPLAIGTALLAVGVFVVARRRRAARPMTANAP